MFGACENSDGTEVTVTAGTNESFTKREDFGHTTHVMATEDAIKSGTGATSAQFTFSASALWNCVVATFKPFAGAATDDVLWRFGSMGATDGSGLVMAAFAAAGGGGATPGGTLLDHYYRHLVQDLV